MSTSLIRRRFHSFEPPFDQINPNSGDRTLSDAWKTSGSTEVNRNFARVTPDRQSKSGGIWSKQQLKTNTLSATFKFRISGQGEKFFGDGIAIWCVPASTRLRAERGDRGPSVAGSRTRARIVRVRCTDSQSNL